MMRILCTLPVLENFGKMSSIEKLTTRVMYIFYLVSTRVFVFILIDAFVNVLIFIHEYNSFYEIVLKIQYLHYSFVKTSFSKPVI